MNKLHRVLVAGVGSTGSADWPDALLRRIRSADVLAGGKRHLQAFPDFSGETLVIASDVGVVLERLKQARAAGRRVAVLASGDPLCYGIGVSLRRVFAADELEIIPAPTAFQLAFAALAEPWHDAALLSAHAHSLTNVVEAVLRVSKAAILTDDRNTPAIIAQALLAAGASPETPCAVCENLGLPEQRIIRANLARIAREASASLNVFVILGGVTSMRGERSARGDYNAVSGMPDAAFSTTGGLITKREVRLLSLAELALMPGDVLWDIGAGSGAVSIEAARLQPMARVYAVEQRADMCEHIRENLRRFPAANLLLTVGEAPKVCVAWPDPDAVFVGGNSGRLTSIIALARDRLRPGGRLVINLATVENLQVVRDLLPDAQVAQVNISRGAPIAGMLRFEALNPVFIATWRREVETM